MTPAARDLPGARITRRSLLGGLAALTTVAATGCSSGTGVSADDGFPVGDGRVTLVPPDKRTVVKDLAGTTLDDKQISLTDYRGKVVVLNVWGSWCSPCRHEVPQLVAAAQKTKGVAQFIGLNTRDTSQPTAQAFVRTSKMPYPSIYDPDGKLLLDLAAVPPTAIPSTLVIDKQGRIAARVLSEVDTTTLVGMVSDVAAGK